MGVGSSKNNIQKEPIIKPITSDQLKNLLAISQATCDLYQSKIKNNIYKIEKEILSLLYKNNYDLAKAKMNNILKGENDIAIYDLIKPLLEILKNNINNILSNKECPVELRAPLDSIIYASKRLEINSLKNFTELINQKYGAEYISKAENNEAKLVNKELVNKLGITVFSDELVMIRIKQLEKEKKLKDNDKIIIFENNSDIPKFPPEFGNALISCHFSRIGGDMGGEGDIYLTDSTLTIKEKKSYCEKKVIKKYRNIDKSVYNDIYNIIIKHDLYGASKRPNKELICNDKCNLYLSFKFLGGSFLVNDEQDMNENMEKGFSDVIQYLYSIPNQKHIIVECIQEEESDVNESLPF